jgi:hypothetical protein
MGNYIEVCCNSDYFMNEGGIEIGKDTSTIPKDTSTIPKELPPHHKTFL